MVDWCQGTSLLMLLAVVLFPGYYITLLLCSTLFTLKKQLYPVRPKEKEKREELKGKKCFSQVLLHVLSGYASNSVFGNLNFC